MHFIIVLICLLAFTSGECPAACSGRGTCGPYDMCTCYKGYMGGDCSERVCQFGRAHIDIPKGDLDASKEITGTNVRVAVYSQLWPQGTTEQYPRMTDSGNVNILQNTAHEYSECSSKGDCDRLTGKCVCLKGYEGSACQRATCPGAAGEPSCNGHGVCLTAAEMARREDANVYELWDADVTMGCLCDAGYEGPGCEHRKCKQGVDPMYLDPQDSKRYTNTSYVIFTQDRLAKITGNYSLEFHDVYNQRWQTRLIEYGAECYDVIDALEGLPNRVIPFGSVRCTMWSDYNDIPKQDEPIYNMYSKFHGIKYTLAFPGNPGVLRPLRVIKYLDGMRPSLFSSELENSTLHSFVYPNGFMGEHTEYWGQKCLGVELSLQLQPAVMEGLNYMSEYSYLGDLTLLETRLLQKCLGDADGLASTKSGSGTIHGAEYDWDYGTVYNPHIIRVVQIADPIKVTTDLCPRSTDESIRNGSRVVTSSSNPMVDGGRSGNKGRTCTVTQPNPGFYAALYFLPGVNRFKLMNRPARDYGRATQFAVWTTQGHTQMVSDHANVYTRGEPNEMYSNKVYSINSTRSYPGYTGVIGCESNAESKNGAFTCLEKGDYVFFLDTVRPDRNPEYFNLYTATKVSVSPGSGPYQVPFSRRNVIQLNYAINADYLNPNMTWSVRAYKFYPPTGYNYVSECSNRGLCDKVYGQCECFDMYTRDDCSSLNNMATEW